MTEGRALLPAFCIFEGAKNTVKIHRKITKAVYPTVYKTVSYSSFGGYRHNHWPYGSGSEIQRSLLTAPRTAIQRQTPIANHRDSIDRHWDDRVVYPSFF